MALVASKGDEMAGAVYVKLPVDGGGWQLFEPAPMSMAAEADIDRILVPAFDGDARPEAEVDAYLAQQKRFDPDLWIVDVEHVRDADTLRAWLAGEGRHSIG